MHYRVLCWSRCHVPRVSTWSRLITVSRVTMRPGRESDSYCLLLAAAPRTRAPPRPRDTAAAAPGKLQTSGMAQSAVCLHYLSDFVILTNWHWLQQRFHTPHFLKPTVNNPQDKPKSLRMCRVFSWIGWLPSFNLSLQGKWICCKPFLFTLLCWLVPGFVFLFFVGRKIFGCSISCSSSDGAEMETAASARHGTKLGDLMDLQLKMSFAIFFGLRSEKSGRWPCF